MGLTRPRADLRGRILRSAAARVAVAAAGLALLAAALAPGAAAQQAAVSIPDASLRSAIEGALGKQSGEAITEAEMARLTVLDARYSSIGQLDGLQHAVNMRALYLQGNRISDASSLANLARMQVLALNSNDISEIDLTAMTDLRFLDLGNNDLAAVDLSGQRTRVGENARNSKLYALWLHNNRLTSIDISGLTAIRDRTDGASRPNYVSLRLDRNQLTSVTGLADLRPGAWSLRLEHNRLTSVDLRGAEHLHYVNLNNNPISSTADLPGFSALTNLRRLYLYETNISSIDLSRFSRLERAFLNDNNLTSVDVTGLDSIQRLWLRGNRITQITGLRDIGDTIVSLNLRTNRLSSIDLSGLTGLRQLYLSDNRLTAVDVSALTQLEVLWLDNGSTSPGSTPDPAYQNQITALGRLPRFLADLRLAGNPLTAPVTVASRTGLRKLYVSGGQIAGLSQVAGLTGLTELGLTDMGLTSADLSNLSRLSALEKLDLRGNSIISVSSLAPLVRMTELRLDDNIVSDVSPLSNMSDLKDLYVAGNLIRDFAPLRGLIVAGLRIHGGDEQRGDSPDNSSGDLNGSDSTDGGDEQRGDSPDNSSGDLNGSDSTDGGDEQRGDSPDNSSGDLNGSDSTDGGDEQRGDSPDNSSGDLNGSDSTDGGDEQRGDSPDNSSGDLNGSDSTDGGDEQRGDSPDNFFWDLNASGSTHGWNLSLLATDGVVDNTECGLDLICPGLAIERWVVAIWLVRVLDGGDPEPLGYNRFEDVHPGLQWASHVERLAELGITTGCSRDPARFCPQNPVTRAHMASLLARAFDLQSDTPSGFVDVDSQSPHAASIAAIAAAGITLGCSAGPDRFCPDDLVTRGQSATLIVRARDHADSN